MMGTNSIFLYYVDMADRALMGPRLALLLPNDIEMPELSGRAKKLAKIFKEKLLSKEVIDYITEECCLVEEKFDDDISYKVKDVKYIEDIRHEQFGRIAYTFVNKEQNEIEVYFNFDDIKVI